MTLTEFVEYLKERADSMDSDYCQSRKCKLYRECAPEENNVLCAGILAALEIMEVQLDSR